MLLDCKEAPYSSNARQVLKRGERIISQATHFLLFLSETLALHP